AALIHSSLELRNDAIASLTSADLRLAWSLPKAPCAGISLDQNFERYALADRQGRIQVRQCADDRVLLELPALTNAVQFVFPFSPGGRFLPATYADGLTRLWDLEQREVMLTFRVWWPFQTIDFNADSTQMVSAEEAGQITFHDLAKGGITRRTQMGFTRPWVRFNPDGRLVGVFSSRSKEVWIMDSASGEVTNRILHPDVVRGLAWHPGGQLFATGCADFSAYLW